MVAADATAYRDLLRENPQVPSELNGLHGARGSRAVLRLLLVVLPVVLAGYALGDRGFAYLASVPGTPLYAGEIIILLGCLFAALATGYLKAALRSSVPMALLLVFMAWGLSRTLPFLRLYGTDTIRDATLWYYALTAVLVVALVMAVPELPRRWARWYLPLVVVLLLWSPVSMLLAGVGLTLPGSSGVPLFSHKPGNIAVAVATAIGFLWLVPLTLKRTTRSALTALGIAVIFAIGTQNRGGLVAALAALLVTGVLLGRRSRDLAVVLVATTVVGFVFAWGLDVHVTGGSGRDYSVAQLVENAASITGAQQDNSNLQGTITFRENLWSGVIDLAGSEGALSTGLGFGPNLAQQLGAAGSASDPLRSPHNSHVDVLARMGIIGLLLWVGFWGSWYLLMFRRSRDRYGALSPESRGIIKACMVGVAAILVNAYFDPTLESPQVAIWLWTLAGLGLGVAATRISLHRNGIRRASSS